MPEVTGFTDDIARGMREPEVPFADFENGCNLAGSNACGLGINVGGGAVVGTPEQFTLLDQRGIARVSQISQFIGGSPYVPASDYPSSGGESGTSPDAVIFTGIPSSSGDGTATKTGQCSLVDLSIGWVVDPL